MIIPVAWTLGLELTFYLLVPFLVCRTNILIGVLLFSLGIRFIAYSNGVIVDSSNYENLWSYRFFPFEIALFLSGSLIYILFSKLSDRVILLISKPEVLFLALLSMIGGLCYFRLLLPYVGESLYWIYYSIRWDCDSFSAYPKC